MKKSLCIALVLSVALASAQEVPVRSTEAEPVYIDNVNGVGANELVAAALRQNEAYLAGRQDIKVAEGRLRQAGLRPNPALESSYANGSTLGSSGEEQLSVRYSQLFELGGKRQRRVETATLGVELSQQDFSNRERLLRAEVKTRYFEALMAARNLASVDELLRLTGQSLSLTRARTKEGESSRLEQNLLEVEAKRLESERAIQAGTLESLLLGLQRLTGQSQHLILREETAELKTLTASEAVEIALRTRPDWLAAQKEEEQGRAEVASAKAEAVPDVTGFVFYANNRSRFPQYGFDRSSGGELTRIHDNDNLIGVGVSIPLPFSNRNQGNIAASQAKQESARLRRQYFEKVVRQEVMAAYRRYEAARQARALFADTILRQADDNLRVIRASFELGEMRLLDVLQEQRRALDTKKAYNEVLKEHALALTELEAAVGKPLEP